MTVPQEIPIVDFAGVRARDPAALRSAAREIHRACTGVGFFYIAGHGVPSGVIETAAAAARRFFAFPLATKRSVAANANHRGFHAKGDALGDDLARGAGEVAATVGVLLRRINDVVE